ncbi:MAG: hypothetical protein ACLVHV_17130 [Oscillospiraceae bacterium]
MKKFDLQLFADGNNNDLSARDYQLEFEELLQAVFGAQSYFGDFFGGGLEASGRGAGRTNTLFT